MENKRLFIVLNDEPIIKNDKGILLSNHKMHKKWYPVIDCFYGNHYQIQEPKYS